MSLSDDKLPPPIYLPSSGGYTSSHLMEQPVDRRTFAFRRYSVDQDGRLVSRTRNTNRDARAKPYEHPPKKSPKATTTAATPKPSETATIDQTTTANPSGASKTKHTDASTVARLFQLLVPIMVKEPTAFESKASTICAALDLDPAATADIINTVKQNASPDLQSEEPVQRPIGTTTNPSADMLAPSFTAIKQQQPFSSGSPGTTIWYSSSSTQNIPSPPSTVTPEIGELYVHHNRLADTYDIWLQGLNRQWKRVTDIEKAYHPTIDDRVLSMRANGTPNWITAASFTTIRGRKGKVKIVE